MEMIFNKKDMLSFIEWYDNKKEAACHKTFEEELEEWLKLQPPKE